jgi:hypothetical protein
MRSWIDSGDHLSVIPYGDGRSWLVSHDATHCLMRLRGTPSPRSREESAAAIPEICQRATVAVLNCIYEEEFVGFRYGFPRFRRQRRLARPRLTSLPRTMMRLFVKSEGARAESS